MNRVVTVIDAGRIINPRAARNQIEGSIVMGVGMALFEQTHYDARSGAPINSNFADYIVATNADTPHMDVTFLDYPDAKVNELGARGVGEIGLAGVASAIASRRVSRDRRARAHVTHRDREVTLKSGDAHPCAAELIDGPLIFFEEASNHY